MSRRHRAVRDRLAQRWTAEPGLARADRSRQVVVIGGGVAGLAAATALTERGIEVTLLEREQQFGGRVRSWPVQHGSDRVTMSRGFHAFFRQYYNLRALLRRADPGLERLQPVSDYPLLRAGGDRDSFRGIPRTPPWNLLAFVLRSPSIRLADLGRIDIRQALGLLDVRFPQTFEQYDGISAAEFLDSLRFPERARHLALNVFARSFFADPDDFAAAELIGMFHSYFVGSAEGLLFEVPDDDYDTALWAPLAEHLSRSGVRLRTGATVSKLDLSAERVRIEYTDGDRQHTVTSDAVVVAVDPPSLVRLIGEHTDSVDRRWRDQVRHGVHTAPPFAVWRLWLDRPVRRDRPAFLGTSGFGPVDNVTVLERFERGAAQWADRRRGTVLEVHAYALRSETAVDRRLLRAELRSALELIYPETAAAQILAEEWRVDQDCLLIPPTGWASRPGVVSPDPRLVLAGDAVRCSAPVALMERAATTGFQAANALLAGWGIAGHAVWSVPTAGRMRWPSVVLRRLDRGRASRRG